MGSAPFTCFCLNHVKLALNVRSVVLVTCPCPCLRRTVAWSRLARGSSTAGPKSAWTSAPSTKRLTCLARQNRAKTAVCMCLCSATTAIRTVNLHRRLRACGQPGILIHTAGVLIGIFPQQRALNCGQCTYDALILNIRTCCVRLGRACSWAWFRDRATSLITLQC